MRFDVSFPVSYVNVRKRPTKNGRNKEIRGDLRTIRLQKEAREAPDTSRGVRK